MGVPDGVPDGICGYTLEPEDISEDAVDQITRFEDWETATSAVCCNRKIWKNDRCIWHSEVEEKPANQLQEKRSDTWERLDGAFLIGVTFGREISFAGCSLVGANISGAGLAYVDFTNASLLGSIFSDVNLVYADFTNTDFRYSKISNSSIFGGTLRSTDMLGATLNEVNLANATLNNASFYRSDFKDISLNSATLTGADFREANLAETSFDGANLVNVDLGGATLDNASFHGAELPNSDFRSSTLTNTNFAGAILTGADFWDATLTDADFWAVTFSDSDLGKASLKNVAFEHATLERVNFENSRLVETNLSDADLSDVRFNDAHLLNVRVNGGTEFGDWCIYEKKAYALRELNLIERLTDATDSAKTLAAQLSDAGYEPRFDGQESGFSTGYDDPERANLQKAKNVYRTYQRLHRENDLPMEIPHFYVREKHVRRKLALIEGNTLQWLNLATQRWLMLYGESPWRVGYAALAVILGCALLYPFLGGLIQPQVGDAPAVTYAIHVHADALVQHFPSSLAELDQIATAFAAALYFSVVTFTTLGYGDIQPASPVAKGLAGLESLVGAVLVALLVAVLTRRAMR